MKVSQLKLLNYNIKSANMKTIFLFIIFLFCVFNLNAQKESNIKLKIEAGVLWSSKSNNRGYPGLSGTFLRVEPKLRTSKNTIIGMRIGVSGNYHIIRDYDTQFYVDNLDLDGNAGNDLISFVPTFDYYFIQNNMRPYIGIGVGHYFLCTNTLVSRGAIGNEEVKVSVNNQIGAIFRGGFDVGKLIVGLEYNFIPKTDVVTQNGEKIGTIHNSSIGLSIGFTFGSIKNIKKFKFLFF